MSYPTGYDPQGSGESVSYYGYWEAPLDPNATPGPGEFSLGPGNVAPGYENAPPIWGGVYCGESPPCQEQSA